MMKKFFILAFSFLSIGIVHATGKFVPYVPSTITYTNAKIFGAKGDGHTDDSAAISSACINSAESGIVFLPQGDYNVTNGINVANHYCNFLGDDLGTRLVTTSTMTFMLNYTGASQSNRRWIRNITFYNASGVSGRGVYFNALGYFSIEDCQFSNLEYGVYSNSCNWNHTTDTTFNSCKYAYYSTSINGDILGNNPTFLQHSSTQHFIFCQFIGNTVGFYNENPTNTAGSTDANAFKLCDFLSNNIAIAVAGPSAIQYLSLSVDYGWFENQVRTGTTTINGNVVTNGEMWVNGGPVDLNHVFSDGAPMTFKNGVQLHGQDLHLFGNVTISTDSTGDISNVVDDTNGGYNYELQLRSPNIKGYNPILGITPMKNDFTIGMSSQNVLTLGSSSGLNTGSLPGAASGSPSRSFVNGQGLYGNGAVLVSGTTGDQIVWQANVTANDYYVTSFSIKGSTNNAANTTITPFPGLGASILPSNNSVHISTAWRTFSALAQASSSGGTYVGFQLTSPSTFYFSLVQVVEFTNIADAQAFFNSNTFALKHNEVSDWNGVATSTPTDSCFPGDVRKNSSPSFGGTWAWECVQSSGTWRSMGTISP